MGGPGRLGLVTGAGFLAIRDHDMARERRGSPRALRLIHIVTA